MWSASGQWRTMISCASSSCQGVFPASSKETFDHYPRSTPRTAPLGQHKGLLPSVNTKATPLGQHKGLIPSVNTKAAPLGQHKGCSSRSTQRTAPLGQHKGLLPSVNTKDCSPRSTQKLLPSVNIKDCSPRSCCAPACSTQPKPTRNRTHYTYHSDVFSMDDCKS